MNTTPGEQPAETAPDALTAAIAANHGNADTIRDSRSLQHRLDSLDQDATDYAVAVNAIVKNAIAQDRRFLSDALRPEPFTEAGASSLEHGGLYGVPVPPHPVEVMRQRLDPASDNDSQVEKLRKTLHANVSNEGTSL